MPIKKNTDVVLQVSVLLICVCVHFVWHASTLVMRNGVKIIFIHLVIAYIPWHDKNDKVIYDI